MDIAIDDLFLLRKIEFDAGTTNSNILSDLEWKRARTLISETEELLSSLNQEIERLIARREEVADRLSRFRMAVALHKRLPPELLADIFSRTLTEDSVKFPPELSKPPRVLRRVCSSWRQVALHESSLSSWNHINLDMTGLKDEKLSRLIHLIHHVAPPPALMSIIALNRPIRFLSNPVIQKLIVPNVSRIRHLYIDIDISTFVQLCEATGRHFFGP